MKIKSNVRKCRLLYQVYVKSRQKNNVMLEEDTKRQTVVKRQSQFLSWKIQFPVYGIDSKMPPSSFELDQASVEYILCQLLPNMSLE